MEVIALACDGHIGVKVETFSLKEGPAAYQRLHDGRVQGRAVIIP